jgi:hypothetical protein
MDASTTRAGGMATAQFARKFDDPAAANLSDTYMFVDVNVVTDMIVAFG